jgi:hypothetical protein
LFKIQVSSFFLFLFAIFCTVCFQVTEVKVYNIKLNEILCLLTLPVIIFELRYINRHILYLILFFIALFIITIFLNLNQDFYLDLSTLSLLKQPYFISLSRLVEYIACVAFVIVVYKVIYIHAQEPAKFAAFLDYLLFVNFLLSLFFIVYYYLVVFKIIPLNYTDIVYNATPYFDYVTHRLRGFYVEGGPLGLMYGFLFCLSRISPKRRWFYSLTFATIVFLAQSKAGMIAIIGWGLYQIYKRYGARKHFKLIVLSIAAPLFIYFSAKIAYNYLDSYRNYDVLLKDRLEDKNFVMGRLAATFIGPRMVADNPVLGVGLGNYALVRNNPEYLGKMPPVTDWDAPGLGAYFTLILENGFLGLFVFLLIIRNIYKNYAQYSDISRKSVALFLIICLLGVQLHFIYFWFLIGLAIAAPREESYLNEINE